MRTAAAVAAGAEPLVMLAWQEKVWAKDVAL